MLHNNRMKLENTATAIVCMAMILAFSMISYAKTDANEPPVGWCTFYPGVDVGSDVIGKSGASMLSVTQSGWGIESIEGKLDFNPMDSQLKLASENNLALALISETNPVYSPAWLNDRAKAAGENTIGSGGQDGGVPTFSSPIFKKAQDDLIKGMIEHVKQVDTNRVIQYYHPGCEWWFPHRYRYNELEINQFRGWLQKKYGMINELNQRWVSKFASFKDVPAPKIDSIEAASGEMGKMISSDMGEEHCSWSIGGSTGPDTDKRLLAVVESGKQYELSVLLKTDNLQGAGAFISVAWITPQGGAPTSGGASKAIIGTHDWTKISTILRAPKDAGRAWILLKVAGAGTVYFDDVSIREVGTNVNLAPNGQFEIGTDAPEAWSFQNWTGGKNVINEYLKTGGRNNSKCLKVQVKEIDSPFKNLDAAIYDWSTFWYEYAADYINNLSGIYKKYDPTRATVTYLTFSFGYPAEWDFTQQMSISPDEVASRGSNIDAVGMQICAADGDPYRATACLDLVRKYNKPMWACDLVDFTSGVYIGYPKMDKITQSVVQHGAKGIVYCLWHLPGVIDYSFYPNMDIKDMNKMLTDARSSINLLDGFKVKPDIALIEPILPASSRDANGYKNNFKSFMGWYKILEQMQLTFDIVTLKEIDKGTADLKNYKWIMLPDCAYLSEKSLDKLSAYTKSGGKLTTSGRFGLFSEIATPLPKSKIAAFKKTLPDYGAQYTGNIIRETRAGNTPPLFLWGAETPLRDKVFADANNALNRIIAGSKTRSETYLSPANRSIRSVIHETSTKKAYYLVNMGDTSMRKHSLRFKDAISHRITIYADNKNVSATSSPAGTKPATGSLTSIKLPEFKTSCIVIVEK